MDDALSLTGRNGLVMRNSFQMSFHSMENWEGGACKNKKEELILCPTSFAYDEIHKIVMETV